MPDNRTGLERLRSWRESLGVPPAVGRVGAVLEDAVHGKTTVRLPLTEELRSPHGLPSGAIPALLADVGLTTAVVSTLPDALGVATVSLTLDMLAPTPEDGALVAVCMASAGEGPRYARGEVHDGAGNLVAVVSGWLLVLPTERPGALRQGLVHEPAAANVAALLALDDDGRFLAREALSNVSGTLHGGIGAMATVLAAERAVQGCRVLTAAVTYERPVPAGATAQVGAEVLRHGRRATMVEAELRGQDGRAAVRTRVVLAPPP